MTTVLWILAVVVAVAGVMSLVGEHVVVEGVLAVLGLLVGLDGGSVLS